MPFQRATKSQARIRLALGGVSGAGKTYSGMIAASVFAQGQPFAVVDSERGSASLYADKFTFDVLELNDFHPDKYVDAIHQAEQDYPVILLDSITPEWNGKNGVLQLHEKETLRDPRHDSYGAWRVVTPIHDRFVASMLESPAHVIATMRTKTEYSRETDERGKSSVKKLGMAPQQRDGMEYEFTIWADMDINNNLIVSKTRFDGINGEVVNKPDAAFFQRIYAWATDGEPMKAPVIERDTAVMQAMSDKWATLQRAGAAKGIDIPPIDWSRSDAELKTQHLSWTDAIESKDMGATP